MLRFLAVIAAFLIAGICCEVAIVQFQLYDIAADKSYDPVWETTDLTTTELDRISLDLAQPFFYFGSGGNTHNFINRDNTLILKFFKQYDWRSWYLSHTPRHLEKVFTSYKIANEKLREETGVLCLHLNKTDRKFGRVFIEDNLGFSHPVDLDDSQFVLQKHARPVFKKIDREIKCGNDSGAKSGILAMLKILESIAQKGVKISSPPKRKNFGFADDRVIAIDIDNFVMDKGNGKKEMRTSTRHFRSWLKKNHPELYLYFNEELNMK